MAHAMAERRLAIPVQSWSTRLDDDEPVGSPFDHRDDPQLHGHDADFQAGGVGASSGSVDRNGRDAAEKRDGDEEDLVAAITAALAAAMPGIVEHVSRLVGGRRTTDGQQEGPTGRSHPSPVPTTTRPITNREVSTGAGARPRARATTSPRSSRAGTSHTIPQVRTSRNVSATTSGNPVPAGAAALQQAGQLPGTKAAPTAMVMYESLRRRNVIDKFESSSTMPAELWIAVYEQATTGITSRQRVELLLSYVTKDALRWYGQFVTPHAKTMDWPIVREMFVKKFARLNVQPILAAKDMHLRSDETIQSYFDEKTRLLELARLPQSSMVALLTDGVPDDYRAVICANGPNTISDWLNVAQRYEVTMKQADETAETDQWDDDEADASGSLTDHGPENDPDPQNDLVDE